MSTRSFRRFILGSLSLLAALFASAGWAANEALSLVINSAPPGGTTSAKVKILNPADVEAFSLKLTFASGGILSLPAANWFTRGGYFPSNPFGPAPTVDLNHFDDSGARTQVYMDGFKPAGTSGEIGAIALKVSASAANGDSQVVTLSGEIWSRSGQKQVTLLPVSQTFQVGAYLSDSDGDGIPDATDNCPSMANANQANFDGDAQGDACDPDDDNDGRNDTVDAFPLDPAEWLDTDHDGIGDNADPDDDNDGVLDGSDNCPLVANPDQRDTDQDGKGDACEFCWECLPSRGGWRAILQ